MSDMNDIQKLVERVSRQPRQGRQSHKSDIFARQANDSGAPGTLVEPSAVLRGLQQWTTDDDRRFVAASRTVKTMPPGLYDIQLHPSLGLLFQRMDFTTAGLIRFPDANSEKVIKNLQRFWERAAVFKAASIAHKRGVLFWGPPGSGKSCTIKQLMQGVHDLGGVSIMFGAPELVILGLRQFREVQPDTPVLILMEDLDKILERYNESAVLNILDGVEDFQKIVFVATTNYPERLGAQVLNRPSRFDRVVLIDYPDACCRRIFLEHLAGEGVRRVMNLDKWVKDTEGLTLAHIMELYQAVVIMEDDYAEVLLVLKAMSDMPVSKDYVLPQGRMGLLHNSHLVGVGRNGDGDGGDPFYPGE